MALDSVVMASYLIALGSIAAKLTTPRHDALLAGGETIAIDLGFGSSSAFNLLSPRVRAAAHAIDAFLWVTRDGACFSDIGGDSKRGQVNRIIHTCAIKPQAHDANLAGLHTGRLNTV
jgi:hypothetical protein